MSTTRLDEITTIDSARNFELHELFFSTTDVRGFIRSSNEVFVRISGYSADELLGKPHNIIRHPHMPRIVFKLLWDELEAGRSIAAYVKNRAKDGSYYWVLAAARPIPGGYLSVRMKPTSDYFAAIQPVYGELRGIEAEIEAAGGSRTEAMQASGARLEAILRSLGFADYGAFMRTIVVEEVRGRATKLANRQVVDDPGAIDSAWSEAVRASRDLARELSGHVGRIHDYLRLNELLIERSARLVGFAEEGKMLSLNAVLAARRLNQDGVVLAAVADTMKQTFPEVIALTNDVVAQADAAGSDLRQLAFSVALAVLQNDASTQFLTEIGRSDDPSASLESVAMMTACLRDDVTTMAGVVDRVVGELSLATKIAGQLERDLMRLTAIERSGRIEASRVPSTGSFATLFDRMRSGVHDAHEQTRDMVGFTRQAMSELEVGNGLLAAVDRVEAALTRAVERRPVGV